MTLSLREADITRLLRMPDVITAVEAAFRQQGVGRAVNRPRQRITTDGSVMHVMSAALPDLGVMGLKAYSSAPGGTRFVCMLYSTETGELLAVMEANRLGQMRTGAASAVAAKYLARPESGAVGIIGTGWQARSQIAALAVVRPVALVKAYSRDLPRRTAFAEEMTDELGADVVAVDSAAEAVADADIVVTATSARDPVVAGQWLRPGMHVTAVGSNWAARRELDADAVARADRIVVDDLEQARIESGDLIAPADEGLLDWSQVSDLGAVVAGNAEGRRAGEEITLFESQGIALEDVAAMKLAYELAVAQGVGETLAQHRES
ncbi:MAG TPA: ornithine cyclodeaminase family protein [bacterium]|jgi:ornithine cyclodeaminase/alanine dehydrogenase|nr:ornithine cyclodeaminase family protein [bacterium]